jgi:hypothetical protein
MLSGLFYCPHGLFQYIHELTCSLPYTNTYNPAGHGSYNQALDAKWSSDGRATRGALIVQAETGSSIYCRFSLPSIGSWEYCQGGEKDILQEDRGVFILVWPWWYPKIADSYSRGRKPAVGNICEERTRIDRNSPICISLVVRTESFVLDSKIHTIQMYASCV